MTPFKQGHTKKGGRKPGTPNKLTRDLREAIVAAGEAVGIDSTGSGGVVGYLTCLAAQHPALFVTLLVRVLPLPSLSPPQQSHSIDMRKLEDEELMTLERLYAKARVPLVPDLDNDESEKSTDDDRWRKKIAKLLEESVKAKKKS